MTLTPINNSTLGSSPSVLTQSELTQSALTKHTQSADSSAAPTPHERETALRSETIRETAQQFEAIFMRQLLGSMEKAAGFGAKGPGAQVYGSLLVGALADNTAQSGGIGLADVIVRAMLAERGERATTTPADEQQPRAKAPDPSVSSAPPVPD